MRSFSPPAIVFAIGGLLTTTSHYLETHARHVPPRPRTEAEERAAKAAKAEQDAPERLATDVEAQPQSQAEPAEQAEGEQFQAEPTQRRGA